MDINRTISQNIRRIRDERKLTLDAAAKATGVSRSMLAQMEKGDVNPTISVLWKIANGYRTSFSSLTEREQEFTRIIHGGEVAPLMEDAGGYVNYPVFAFEDQRPFETYRILIAPGGRLRASAHMGGTEEYITVFSGKVIISANEAAYTLHTGDSLRFRADVDHSYENPGDEEAQLSMLIYYSK